jgi:hypothetical protein
MQFSEFPAAALDLLLNSRLKGLPQMIDRWGQRKKRGAKCTSFKRPEINLTSVFWLFYERSLSTYVCYIYFSRDRFPIIFASYIGCHLHMPALNRVCEAVWLTARWLLSEPAPSFVFNGRIQNRKLGSWNEPQSRVNLFSDVRRPDVKSSYFTQYNRNGTIYPVEMSLRQISYFCVMGVHLTCMWPIHQPQCVCDGKVISTYIVNQPWSIGHGTQKDGEIKCLTFDRSRT